MGQAGAQREPSMEEILASIRRIIESNEPGDAAASSLADDDASGVSAQPETERPSGDADMAATETEFPLGSDTAGEADGGSTQAAPAVSLADVAARVRAAPEETVPEDAPSAERESGMEAVIDDAVAEELRQALVSDDHVAEATAGAERQVFVKTPDIQERAPVQADTHPEDTHRADAHQADTHRMDDADASIGQLVSLHTGEKVAAAFHELNAAIAAGQTRSFDEMAEDMLRPMLTQWLDDNLPTLVERLVREEIERVSRGNRR
jgi:cell pole-organizing protein PopZ